MRMLATAHSLEQTPGAGAFSDVIPEDSTGPQMALLPVVRSGTSSHVAIARLRREPGAKALVEVGGARATVSTIQYDDASMRDGHQTGIATRSTLTVLLEETVRAGDYRTFAALANETDWSVCRPDELTTAIDLALSRDMAALAIKLAQLGGRLFPDHERVQRAARVLAPPVVRVVRLPRARGLEASRTWLREHASQYRGQWVAVREGQLLGAAESLDELMPLIGEGEDAISTIVIRVL